jgi:hypothetical protein
METATLRFVAQCFNQLVALITVIKYQTVHATVHNCTSARVWISVHMSIKQQTQPMLLYFKDDLIWHVMATMNTTENQI